ncbi:integrase, catalytic region, zinc finger, CCHC-type containing protein, partial [Tanacetum coccineum]
MSTLNQQTLADSGANERPPMLEKGNYIPWESRFKRFSDNKLEEGDRMWRSIKKGPYVRPMISNPDKPTEQILEPLSKMTEGNKKQYSADVKVMNCLLQAIPNDIYNSVDACKNAKDMWDQIKRLMYGSNVTNEYQRDLQGISEDKLTTAMMLLARAITQKNAGRQNKAFNAGNRNDESNQIVQRVPRTKSTPSKANIQCYNCNEIGHYAHDCQKPRVRDAKYFREQMLLAMKDEAGNNLKDEENDFMLDNSYGDYTLEELTAAVIMMAQIQPADENAESKPSYDAKAVSEVNASNKVHGQVNHAKRRTIIHTSDDD